MGYQLFFYILIAISVFGLTNCSSSTVNLCIRNNTRTESTCKLTSTILSSEEKSTFMKTMCVNQKDLKDDYRFIKIQNDIAIEDESYKTICDGTSYGVFAWIPYKTFQMHVDRTALDTTTTDKRFLARATDSKAQNQFCHFTDLSGTEQSFFACVLVVFEDDFFSLESDLQVLVELLPIRYEIRNVRFEEWTNVTEGYKTALGKTVLKNPFIEKTEIFASLEYSYMEKIKMDLKEIYSDNKTTQLPVTIQYRENSVPLENGVGSVLLKSKTAFSWPLEPKTSIKVDVIGQWSEHRKQFSADLYNYYGIGLSLKKNPLKSTKISFIKIINAEHVFENTEILKHSKVTHSKHLEHSSKSESKTANEIPTTDHVYPEFYPIFIIGCCIVGTTFLVAMCGVIRANRRYSKQKHAGML